MEGQSASRAIAAIGSMIFSTFGAACLIAWSNKAFLVAVLQFKQNQAARAVDSDSPESERSSRVFNIVNIGQGVAILIAANGASIGTTSQAWLVRRLR